MFSKTESIKIGTSIDERFERKLKIIDKYQQSVSKEFDVLFRTDEERKIANISLEVSSRLLFEFLKEEAEYGR